jgi:hypothetical protein
MLSLLYKAFSTMLVVSMVFFSNIFQNKLLSNVCTTRFRSFLYSCFFFSDILQTKLHCSINNTFSVPRGFLVFFFRNSLHNKLRY